MIYWLLFLSFLKIGAFSFGGGYAALPLIRDEVVLANQWLSAREFTDLITISQMTPGPIAINSATFVGMRVAGPLGAIVSTLGSVFPACILVTLLAILYNKYKNMDTLQIVLKTLRPAVVAMIATAGVFILKEAVFGEQAVALAHANWAMVLIFLACTAILRRFKINPIYVMLLGGVLNLIWVGFLGR